MAEKRGRSEGIMEGLRGTVYGVKGLYKIRA
jgi:hypothetical protein